MGVCYIVCALPQAAMPQMQADDFVIAADGGLKQLQERRADLVVGDFDSLGYVPEGDNVVRHPVRKDDTDSMLAARLGLARGFQKFILLGGVGGRLDHTLANIQTLAFLRNRGARACLAGETETIALIQNESLRFQSAAEGVISVFAYGKTARGVTERGLSFSLDNAVLTDRRPLGVSNAFTGAPAEVRVRRGRLLVLWSGGPWISSLFS